MALLYGRNIIDALHERVGDEEQLRGDPSLTEPNKFNGVWGRFIAREARQKSSLGIYGNGPAYKMDTWALQAGFDVYRHEDEDGDRDHVGLYGAYGHVTGKVTHNLLDEELPGGKVVMHNWSLAGYWTHFEPNGAYLDAVVQGTWLDIHESTLRISEKKTDGFNFAVSAEGGYPLVIDEDWRLEPQAQLIYQTMSIDRTEDIAASIRFRDLNSLAGRVGVRLNNVGLKEGWLRLNLWHEFMGKPKTEFSSDDGFVPFVAKLPRTWGEIDGGLSFRVSRKLTFFGSASYNSTFNGHSYSYDGKLGFRINW
jgi:outer membrane autotransporter protein